MKYLSLIGFIFGCSISLLKAQFYVGSQQEFGKNTVQYSPKISWKTQHYEGFSLYFQQTDAAWVDQITPLFHNEILRIEDRFQFQFRYPIDFFIFPSLEALQESTIGQGKKGENLTGSTLQIGGKRISIYREITQDQLVIQLRRLLAESMLNQLLFGEKWSDVILGNSAAKHPKWFIQGFCAYYAKSWNASIDAQMKDAFLTGRLDDFSLLSESDSELGGQALWSYIERMYGLEKVQAILALTPIAQHIDRAMKYEIGLSSYELLPELGNYFKKIYWNDVSNQQDINATKLLIPIKKNRINTQFQMNPVKHLGTWVEFEAGKYWIKLYDFKTGKTTIIFKQGVKLNTPFDASLINLAWNPTGEILTFFHETEGELKLSMFEIKSKQLTTKSFGQLDKIQSFSYSNKGTSIVISGVVNGQSDLYLLTIAGNSLNQLTNDRWEELDPVFKGNDLQIVFASTRPSDSTFQYEIGQHTTDIYELNLRNSGTKKHLVLHPITQTPLISESHPIPFLNNQLGYLSDESGTINFYKLHRDSSIIAIDTVMHYHYSDQAIPLTNYTTNILDIQTDPKGKTLTFQVFQNNRFKSYQLATDSLQTVRVKATFWQRKQENEKESSPKSVDSLTRNLTTFYQKALMEELKNKFSKEWMNVQVTTNFLNGTYQRYGGEGSSFTNPFVSLLIRNSYTDLVENIKIGGSLRIPFGVNASEFLGYLELNQRKWDQRFTYYRQVYTTVNTEKEYQKWITQELKYRVLIPYSSAFSWRHSLAWRNDNTVVLATDEETIKTPNHRSNQLGYKSEWVFDNSIYTDLNTWKGWKSKIFSELNVVGTSKWMLNLGCDVRYSKMFYKDMVWVNRLAGATSLGTAQVVYYLGGIDNWSLRPAVYSQPSMPVDPSKNYYYQSIATPMRGFLQNSRNGNSFFVINSEFRIPVGKLLTKHALKNEVLRTFQWLVFTDIGCAWTGITPFSSDNYFNTLSIQDKPIEIQLLNSREPIIGGIGSGIRTKAFGYFLRLDLAWGVENFQIKNKPVAYFSIGYDL